MEKKKKSSVLKIKLNEKKKKEIEWCAKQKGVSFNRFIKDAINDGISAYKTTSAQSQNVLENQLELFDLESYDKGGAQLNINL